MDVTTIQLVNEACSRIDAKPGCIAKYGYEYERNRVCNIFIFYEFLGGIRHFTVTDHRTKNDYAWQFNKLLDHRYPQAEKAVLVIYNSNNYTDGFLYETFPPADARILTERLEIYYTTKRVSWRNFAEIELRVLSGQILSRRVPDKKTLIELSRPWVHYKETLKSPKLIGDSKTRRKNKT